MSQNRNRGRSTGWRRSSPLAARKSSRARRAEPLDHLGKRKVTGASFPPPRSALACLSAPSRRSRPDRPQPRAEGGRFRPAIAVGDGVKFEPARDADQQRIARSVGWSPSRNARIADQIPRADRAAARRCPAPLPQRGLHRQGFGVCISSAAHSGENAAGEAGVHEGHQVDASGRPPDDNGSKLMRRSASRARRPTCDRHRSR